MLELEVSKVKIGKYLRATGDLSRNVGGSALSGRQQEVFYRLDYEGKLVRAPGKSCRMKEDCVVSFRM